ncbi:hypothetical protein DLAC_08826 [Tieghemostelium lacteum]|uniref:Matrin-type domain-containing protein n=1 Tax=Tieghemostelium lacteum TaxID=361077 RepID=A0A151Z8G2_TIELA|nr:hypothetical protein DLAC_08826 [Tieghemostelium lacteum]|eukprot:KYQ90225.1 hypothetical protein DLAC_08826 [Tieghemostelium lacteum]
MINTTIWNFILDGQQISIRNKGKEVDVNNIKVDVTRNSKLHRLEFHYQNHLFYIQNGSWYYMGFKKTLYMDDINIITGEYYTEYKKESNARHWCKYCKIYIHPNSISIKNHEEGWNHKRNESKAIDIQNREKRNEDREQHKIAQEIKNLKSLGNRAFKNKDLTKEELEEYNKQQQIQYQQRKQNQNVVGNKRKLDDSVSNNVALFQPKPQKIEDKDDPLKELSQHEREYIENRIKESKLQKKESIDKDNENKDNEEEENEEEENEEDKKQDHSAVVGEWQSVDQYQSAFGSDYHEEEYDENQDEQEEYQDDSEDDLVTMNKRVKLDTKSSIPMKKETKLSFSFKKKDQYQQDQKQQNNIDIKQEIKGEDEEEVKVKVKEEKEEPIILKFKSNNNRSKNIRKTNIEDKQR